MRERGLSLSYEDARLLATSCSVAGLVLRRATSMKPRGGFRAVALLPQKFFIVHHFMVNHEIIGA